MYSTFKVYQQALGLKIENFSEIKKFARCSSLLQIQASWHDFR